MNKYVLLLVIVVLIKEFNFSFFLMASCKWRGVIRLIFRFLLALFVNFNIWRKDVLINILIDNYLILL